MTKTKYLDNITSAYRMGYEMGLFMMLKPRMGNKSDSVTQQFLQRKKDRLRKDYERLLAAWKPAKAAKGRAKA